MVFTPDFHWVRIAAALGCAVGFALIATVYASFLKQQGTGHRRLLLLGTIMFTLLAVARVVEAWGLYSQDFVISAWVTATAAICVLSYSGYLYLTRHDSLITLKRSEFVDQIWHRKIVNTQQIAINSRYIAEKTYENVHRLTHVS